jgi:sugar/nucleoside kinase (ribokinase family)
MPRILCVGDLMLDVVVLIDSPINYASDTPAKISTHGGGAAANTATWLSYSGNNVYFVARTGDDAAADAVIRELDSWKIEHGALRQTGLKTGVVVVIVDESGQRTMFPDSGANSGLSSLDLPSLDGFDAAFISGYSLFNKASNSGVLEMIDQIKSAGIPLFFDPASVGTISHFGKDAAVSYLSKMDILLMNEEEALYLSNRDSCEAALVELGKQVETVVIKRGSAGAIGASLNSAPVLIETDAINSIDTTGAGDAFAAGFIPSWIENKELDLAMSAGNKLAAQCVAIIGARPSVNPQ